MKGIAAALGLLGAAVAAAHWLSPEAIVADLNGPAGRSVGVERAVRDDKAPRLLVIRVDGPWYAMPVEKRRTQAAAWHDHWRENIEQGIVAVLDARTDTPVVRFGPGGRVVTATDRPTSAETPP